jgi:hypothetical protein
MKYRPARPELGGRAASRYYAASLASPEQRYQLVNLLYEDVWVSGPVVKYVRPSLEMEPLLQTRTGTAQSIEGEKYSNPSVRRAVTLKSGRGGSDKGRGSISERSS